MAASMMAMKCKVYNGGYKKLLMEQCIHMMQLVVINQKCIENVR